MERGDVRKAEPNLRNVSKFVASDSNASALFQFDFRMSRFGASHGFVGKTGASAQTAHMKNRNFELEQSTGFYCKINGWRREVTR
jgi:hypothetical protein